MRETVVCSPTINENYDYKNGEIITRNGNGYYDVYNCHGELLYCYGETLEIVLETNDKVLLLNPNNENTVFEIDRKVFERDF